MRKFLLFAGLAFGMAWAHSAHAQSSSILQFPSTLNINVQPNITNNSPMDYRNVNAPIGTTYTRPANNGSSFSLRLGQMFFQPTRSNYIASTTTFGSSVFPTPTQMQAAAPSYFMPFQMYRGAPIQR